MNLLRVLFLLLASVALIAQDQSSQPSAGSQQPSGEQSTSVGGATDKDQPLFKGCLSGTKDNYSLKDESGNEYRLHSDKDISEHVGNMVEIRGTIKKEDQRPAAGEAPGAAPREQEIDVADVKTVSKGCAESEKR